MSPVNLFHYFQSQKHSFDAVLSLTCVCVCVCQICSLMRGGIAERGGVRVGHRIIEINGQSVVATAHEKIVQALSNSVGEVSISLSLSLSVSLTHILTETEFCPSFLPDPHEDHAGSHVQAPHRPGDAHVHINPVLPGTRCQDVGLAVGPRRNQAGPRPDWRSPGAGVSVSSFSW